MERHGGTADGDTPLSARLRVTAHWLLWAAGKGLAILLLALAGGYGTGRDGGGGCGELGRRGGGLGGRAAGDNARSREGCSIREGGCSAAH